MADIFWEGGADPVAQVSTGTITGMDGTPADNTFIVTIGGVAISAVGDTDIATTATALRTALNASTHPYFSTITWSGSAGSIIGTADTAGVPFTAAMSETGAGSGSIGAFSTGTSSAGPNDWSSAANWSGKAVPGGSDNVYITGGPSICWGLATSGTKASTTIGQTYTGKVGLDTRTFATNADASSASTAAPEYRQAYLQPVTTLLSIGEHVGPGKATGSTRLMIDTSTTATTTIIYNTAKTASETTMAPLRMIAASSTSDTEVRGGIVGIGTDQWTEAPQIDNLLVSGGQVYARCRIDEAKISGGTVVLHQLTGTLATLEVSDGTATTEGTQAVTTLRIEGGTVFANSSGTIGTANMQGGTLDMSGAKVARTITALNLLEACTVVADDDVVTISTLSANLDRPYTLNVT